MKELRPKNKEFVKKYIKNGNNATQAIKEVFKIKDDNNAAVKGCVLLSNIKVQNEIKSIADSIPDSLLVEKHLELLNKKDVLYGIDTQAVKSGLDMAYKLKGVYAAEKKDITTDGKPLIDITTMLEKIYGNKPN